jgi:hypothetical protein
MITHPSLESLVINFFKEFISTKNFVNHLEEFIKHKYFLYIL